MFNKTNIIHCAEILKKGGIIAYPTETVYGLGVDATNRDAIQKLARLKNRDDSKAFTVLLKSKEEISQYAEIPSQKIKKLIDTYLPGPLTIILKAKSHTTRLATEYHNTIGIRVSAQHEIQELFKYFTNPIVTTSANLTGTPPAENTEQIKKTFGDKIDGYLLKDKDLGASGIPSTIISVLDDNIKILRQGSIIIDL